MDREVSYASRNVDEIARKSKKPSRRNTGD